MTKCALAFLIMLLTTTCAYGQRTDECSKTGENPIWQFVINNKPRITAEEIADNQANLPDDVLTNAVIFGYRDLVFSLLKNKSLVKTYGGEALTAAASMGRLDVLRLLLAKGIPANATNKTGTTAIYGAVQYDCVDSVKLLLRHGANINYRPPNLQPGSNTLMVEAVTDRHFKVAAILLENGYTVTAEELQLIKTILLKQGNLSVWEFLFEKHHGMRG